MNENAENMINHQEEGIDINLAEIVQGLWKGSLWIVISGLLFAILGIIWTKAFITPLYQSTTKMYVSTRTEGSVTYNDLITGSQLTKDYIELIKSRQVLEQTINALNLDTTPKKLRNMINVISPTDTRIITITVKDVDAKRAKEIADTLRKISSVSIKEITAADSVSVVEEGNVEKRPVSPNLFKNAVFAGAIGSFLMALFIVLRSILDDTIKTAEDVEKYLGLSTLARIPCVTEKMIKDERKRKRGNRQ